MNCKKHLISVPAVFILSHKSCCEYSGVGTVGTFFSGPQLLGGRKKKKKSFCRLMPPTCRPANIELFTFLVHKFLIAVGV